MLKSDRGKDPLADELKYSMYGHKGKHGRGKGRGPGGGGGAGRGRGRSGGRGGGGGHGHHAGDGLHYAQSRVSKPASRSLLHK